MNEEQEELNDIYNLTIDQKANLVVPNIPRNEKFTWIIGANVTLHRGIVGTDGMLFCPHSLWETSVRGDLPDGKFSSMDKCAEAITEAIKNKVQEQIDNYKEEVK